MEENGVLKFENKFEENEHYEKINKQLWNYYEEETLI